MWAKLDNLIQNHMLISRSLVAVVTVVWLILVGVFVDRWYQDPSSISNAVAAVVSTISAVITLVIKSYFDSRQREKDRKDVGDS